MELPSGGQWGKSNKFSKEFQASLSSTKTNEGACFPFFYFLYYKKCEW